MFPLCAVLNIVLNYFLIINWGIPGTAVATLLSYTALFLFHHFTAAKIENPYRYPHKFKEFLPWIVMAIAGSVMFSVFMETPIIRWGVAFILGSMLLFRIIKQRAFY